MWNLPENNLPRRGKNLWEQAAFWHKVKVVSAYHVIPVGDRSAADLFVLIFEASRSGEVMIVSVPSAFQVRSLQQLVKLQTELARRTACFKSSYRRSTTFCKINNDVHAPFHSVFRRGKTPLISC